MPTDLEMPQMGESVVEGTVTKWHVKKGARVEKDQTVLSISTDKVDAEIPAPVAGVITEILVQEGNKVNIGTVLARIDEGGGEGEKPAKEERKGKKETPREEEEEEPVRKETKEAPDREKEARSEKKETAPPREEEEERKGRAAERREKPSRDEEGGAEDRSGYYSPLVMNIARTEGITNEELSSLRGSGTGGRVTKKDVMAYLDQKASGGPREAKEPAAAREEPAAAPMPPAAKTPAAGEHVEVQQMDSMRRAIAEHMVRSVHTSPHVTSIHEVDMTRLAQQRDRVKEAFLKREGVKLTFTSFFVAAAARALRQHPWVNASVDGDKILVKKRINVGVAVAVDPGGLIVPVVKDADTLNLVGIARTVDDLIKRARARKLAPDDVAGGTFTITNLGSAGSLTGTPIISQPQVAIMGVGIIQKRPVVIDDMIAIRQMMYLSLAYDHRLVDGMLAGRFLTSVTEQLQSMEIESLL